MNLASHGLTETEWEQCAAVINSLYSSTALNLETQLYMGAISMASTQQ